MTKEIVKEGYDEAQNSLKEKQVAEVKLIVLETLKKIDNLRKDKKIKQKEIKELDDQIKILESDIEDLKVGRIDRIVERQEKDEKAKNTSVVIIIKEKEIIREPWYQPYVIERWNTPIIPTPWISPTWCQANASICNTSAITCSTAKFATVGTYDVNGSITYVR